MIVEFIIKKKVEYGEALFLIGPLESFYKKKEIEDMNDIELTESACKNLGQLKSYRFEWNEDNIWNYSLELNIDTIMLYEGVLTYIIVKSYYYKRDRGFFEYVAKNGKQPVPRDIREKIE